MTDRQFKDTKLEINNSTEYFITRYDITNNDLKNRLRKFIKVMYLIKWIETRSNFDILTNVLSDIRVNAFLAFKSFLENDERVFFLYVRTITELLIKLVFLRENMFVKRAELDDFKYFLDNSMLSTEFSPFKALYSDASSTIHNGKENENLGTAIEYYEQLNYLTWQNKTYDYKRFEKLMMLVQKVLIRRFPVHVDSWFYMNKKTLEHLIGKQETDFCINYVSLSVFKGDDLIGFANQLKGEPINLDELSVEIQLSENEAGESMAIKKEIEKYIQKNDGSIELDQDINIFI